MTAGDEPVNINRTLTEFDKECQAEWDSADHDITQGDPLMTLNRVTTSVAKQVIPPVALETTAKLRPSAESKAFAEERAEEIKRGVTPQRRKQLHRKMSRFRRKDYKQWHLQSVNKLNECIQQQRWQAAKKWDRRLRGVPRKARITPSLCYKSRRKIRSDTDASHQWMLYMKDLFARTLVDRVYHGEEWPELQGDPDGPGSEWCDELFNWACARVHTDRAAGHNGIQIELYKYSSWARNKLRAQLKHIWETGKLPEKIFCEKF
jgi:hypothetical protein